MRKKQSVKEVKKLDIMDVFSYGKVLTNNLDLCHEVLNLVIGEKTDRYPIQITADSKGIRFDICSEDIQLNEENRNAINSNIVLKEGEIYTLGGYSWICAELKENYAVMQSTGVTAGTWPGYEMSKFGDGDFYANSINGVDISRYNMKTMNLYNSIKSAEYTGAEYRKGLFLVSNKKVRAITAGSQGSGNYWTALKLAAANYGSFGAHYGASWLGTAFGKSNAWYINTYGECYHGYSQNHQFIIAPAFNLDTSKITLNGTEISIK